MRQLKLTSSATALLSCFAVGSASALEENIEEIIVTATRTPILAEAMPTAVTIITSEDLQKLQINQITDYLKFVPGLTIASSGSKGGTAQLRMRGGEANQTLVLIDGVEVNDPAAGDEFQFEHLTSVEIERIEVIRSPMSAAWGSDALSGVINIVTKKASEPFTASAYGEYGSFDSKRIGGSMGASGDGWLLNAGVGHTKSDGINVSREGDEKDGYKNTSANVRGSIDLAKNISLSASVRHTAAVTEFDGTDWMTSLPADSDNLTKTNKTYVSTSLKAGFMDGRLTETLRFTNLDTEIANFAFGGDNGTTSAKRIGLYWDNLIKLADNHNLTLAMDHENTDFSQAGLATQWGDPNHDQNTKVTGYLADYNGALTEDFTLSLSLRRDNNSDFKDVTSWRFGGAYQVGEDMRIFANASKGQKAPTFIERFGFFADQFLGNPDVKPELSKGYEMGVEYNSQSLMARAVYFHSDLTDEIDGFVFNLDTFLFTAENKEGDSKRNGIELSLESRINEQIFLSANYTYIDATEDDGMGTQIRELRRPKHNGSVAMNIALTDALNVNLAMSYTGKSSDVFYDPITFMPEIKAMESYLLVRIASDYQLSDNLSFYGRVENALDDNYEDVFGFSTPGVAAYAGIRLSF